MLGSIHGTEDGYRSGCKTRAGCEYADSPDFLSCAEATLRRRSDFRLGRLPRDRRLPRDAIALAAPRPSAEPSPAEPSRPVVHGTVWGYRRGCRDDLRCPNWRLGTTTCPDARRAYVRRYNERRRAGDGVGIEHGTSNAYLLGCRDPMVCPGGEDGRTCREARAEHRRRAARAGGVPPRTEAVSSSDAAARVREWLREGHSIRAVAHHVGCGRTTIAELASAAGRRPRISPLTATKILATDSPPGATRLHAGAHG